MRRIGAPSSIVHSPTRSVSKKARSSQWSAGSGFMLLRGVAGAALLDYGLEERRGEEAGELAIGGGVGHGKGSGIGVDGGLFEGRLLQG